MEELWKDIEGYEGVYQVSNTGKIRSSVRRSNIQTPWRLLSPHIARGYAFITLYKQNQRKNLLLHRLVAKAFVDNPNGFAEVNHIDENKLNNNATNLEWCTREYNMAYGTARLRQGISCGQSVDQCTLEGIKIATYCSAEIAGRINGLDPSSIHKCCKHKRKYAGGYQWRYSE